MSFSSLFKSQFYAHFSAPPSLHFGSSDVFKDQSYGVVNCGRVTGRVKPIRILTLLCQKTNPDGVISGGILGGLAFWGCWMCVDGVICGGMNWQDGLRENRIDFDGLLSLINDESFDIKYSMTSVVGRMRARCRISPDSGLGIKEIRLLFSEQANDMLVVSHRTSDSGGDKGDLCLGYCGLDNALLA